MCFRPPDANISKKCEKCGAENAPTDIVCSECGAELSNTLSMPSSAPRMPQAPGVPGMPQAPGVPKNSGAK